MGSSPSPRHQCPRCFQPLHGSARRCPHCGERVTGGTRNVTLVLGICGLVLAAIVLGFGLFLNGNPPNEESPDDSAPAAQPAKPPALDR
jgi:hypothetical protein